jgi:hypothetical protein
VTSRSVGVMRSIWLAIGLVLIGAARTAAQKSDSAASQGAQLSPVAGTGPATQAGEGQWGDGQTARCWVGCTGSLGRPASSESAKQSGWDGGEDSTEARLRQVRQAVLRSQARPAAVSPGAGAPAVQAATRADGASTTPATEAQGTRYLIDEWRRAELGIADSIHHAVLIRITHTYDSAQRSSLTDDQRTRVLREVDGINDMNQMMWFKRRGEVNRTADSLARASGLPPEP